MMKTESEGLDVFFNLQEFATEAWIKGRRIQGLEGYSRVISQEVEAHKIFFTYPSRDLPEISQGDEVTIGEDRYYEVVGIQSDGTGLTVLTLEWRAWT